MAIAGALVGGAIGAFGRKPSIPELPKIDPTKIQQQTIAGNAQNFGEAAALGAQVNEANQKQQLAMLSKALEFALPGGLGQAQSIVASQLRGEVPQDVQESLLRSNAGKAFAGGFAGSGFSGALGLRDLGLTSLGIQQQGLSNFSSLASMVPQTPMFDITSMFFTPQQRLDFEFQQNQAQFQRNLMFEQVEAAPDPARAALGREIDRFFNTAAQFGMMAAGGAMGGGGGGGGMLGGMSTSGISSGGLKGGGASGGWGYGGSGFNSDWLQQQSTAGSAMGAALG